ncbi:Retrovirus-related Pol polyprotein from transposon 17.6 [Dictyocoela roeselum]|nr:Retrovirus-related Pol polyprotein from transposon 17.6 [Dictyocoela roeselum]
MQPKSLNLTAYIQNIPIRCVLDTGSTYSYISQEFVKEQNLEESETNEIEAELVNGFKIKTKKKTRQNIVLENDNSNIYKADMNIIESKDKFLILGMDFLIPNKVKIDFGEGTLIIGDVSLEIPNLHKTSSIDKMLEDNNTILQSIAHSVPLEVTTLIKDNLDILNVGLIKHGKHKIELKGNKIVYKKPYRIPYKLKEKVSLEIKELEKNEIIRRSNSKFSSPSFPILKKNGDIRLVVDYRELNKLTCYDHYVFPKISDIFFKLHGMKIFSKLDLKKGYYQIEMEESSIKYTAFTVENEKFKWTRMPFGLVDAPKTFQKIMDSILKTCENTVAYLDDILVFSKNRDDHIKHLKQTLETLNINNVKINLEKSGFFKKSVEFLGHTISGDGISPNTNKATKIMTVLPKNKRGLQRILGLLNYFRQFIQNYSLKTLFITDKIKESAGKFSWTEEDKNKLKNLVQEIVKCPSLKFPDPEKPFNLYTDSSYRAIGAILKQGESTIGLYSHKFNNSELNYNIMEKETLGVLLSLQYFRSIVLTNHVVIYTDNQNLIYQKDLTNRIQRWKLLLEEYSYEFKKIEGARNIIADSISRLQYMNSENNKTIKNCIFDKIISQNKEISREHSWIVRNEDNLLIDNKGRILVPKDKIFRLYSCTPGFKKAL